MQHSSPAQTIAAEAILAATDGLVSLSHSIGNDPEIGFEEHRAAARVAEALEAAGFAVEVGAYDLPTAIEASYGEGEVTIAVVGEYDALPDVGHACGHNLIAAAGVGASIGLRAVADQLGVRIKFLGTPAEENGGGKVLMLERGAWDDCTLSLMIHGGPSTQIRTSGGSSQALEYLEIRFIGRSAHAAFAPHDGVNAGDAVTLTQVGIGLLRQQLPTGVVVSSIGSTGSAVNIIPELATMKMEIRSNDAETWVAARARVRDVIAGAALAAGCTYEIDMPCPAYSPLVQDPDLARLFDESLAGLRGDRTEDWAPGMSTGSTDMGDVSAFLPAIHPMVALNDTDGLPHNYTFTQAALSPSGDLVVKNGALSLAYAAIAAVEDDAVRERMLAAQRVRAPHPRGIQVGVPVIVAPAVL